MFEDMSCSDQGTFWLKKALCVPSDLWRGDFGSLCMLKIESSKVLMVTSQCVSLLLLVMVPSEMFTPLVSCNVTVYLVSYKSL